MNFYLYDDYCVFYEYSWKNINHPYNLYVVSLKRENKYELIDHYIFDYRYELIPIYDESKFLIEDSNQFDDDDE